MGQTAGFRTFRMRTLKVRGHCRRHKRVNWYMILNSPNLIVHTLYSKTFSSVCLSRFLEFLPLILITPRSPRGKEKEEVEVDSTILI